MCLWRHQTIADRSPGLIRSRRWNAMCWPTLSEKRFLVKDLFLKYVIWIDVRLLLSIENYLSFYSMATLTFYQCKKKLFFVLDFYIGVRLLLNALRYGLVSIKIEPFNNAAIKLRTNWSLWKIVNMSKKHELRHGYHILLRRQKTNCKHGSHVWRLCITINQS